VPFTVKEEAIEKIKESLPELPFEKFNRFVEKYGILEYDARILIQDRVLADFFEECTKLYTDTKKICNWIKGSVLEEVNARKKEFADIGLTPKDLTTLIKRLDEGILNNLSAKEALRFVIDTGIDADTVIKEKGLAQVSDDATLEKIVDEIINGNEKIVNQIKEGNEKAVGFLVGLAMKKTQGKANPKMIKEIIRRRIVNE